MRVSRLMSASASILVSVALLETGGCQQNRPGPPHGYKNLKCEKNILVTLDAQHKHGVDKEAVYVCEDEPHVTWTKGTGVTTFTVAFKGGICPFDSCQITETSPPPTVNPGLSNQPLTVYPYSITINGNLISDPQVVGGGGHSNVN